MKSMNLNKMRESNLFQIGTMEQVKIIVDSIAKIYKIWHLDMTRELNSEFKLSEINIYSC